MIAWKNVITILTIMMSALNSFQSFAESVGTSQTASSYTAGVALQPPQQSYPPNAVYQTPPGPQIQPQTGANDSEWPNYAYPHYNNPYYDGSSPGSMVAGVIDWALGFPSSVWDRFSEFLDNNLFPRLPATYGGKPQVQSVAPQSGGQQPKNLPAANSYKPDSR